MKESVETNAGTVRAGIIIRILDFSDPFENYTGRKGVIEYIDDKGQLHGTWGGLAVIPEIDHIEIIK